MNKENMNKCFIFVKCDPEDRVTSALEERLNMDMAHVASEITSLEGQAFPLSHMAELNTQHSLDADCVLLVFDKSPRMTAHYIPGEWSLCQLLLKNALFYHCIMKIWVSLCVGVTNCCGSMFSICCLLGDQTSLD